MPNLPDRSLNVTMTLSVNDEHIGSYDAEGCIECSMAELA